MKKYLFLTLYSVILFSLGFFCRDVEKSKLGAQIKKAFHRPSVSVILPTYNRAHALPTAVESILNQTYTDFELIIIDDGSTDGTDEMIEELAKKDNRIVSLRHKTNKGLVAALNTGLDAARGKYIARMDDDDKSMPYRFEREIAAMEAHPEIVILGGQIFSGNYEPPKKEGAPVIINPDEVALDTYFTAGLAHPTIIIRRNFLEKNNIRYDSQYLHAEDTGFYKDVLNAGGKISYIDEMVLNFAVNKNVVKPENYLAIQADSYKKVQKEKIGRFFNVPYEWLGPYVDMEHQCIIYTRMAQINPYKQILNQEALEKRRDHVCEQVTGYLKEIFVIHPRWKDTIQYNAEKKTIFKPSTQDKAQIEMQQDNTVLVNWENWGSEFYQISSSNPPEWIYLKDKDGTIKTEKF